MLNAIPTGISQETIIPPPAPYHAHKSLPIPLCHCTNYQHDGLKQDGTPDKRVSSEHGFGGSDGPDPHVEGAKGGKQGGEQYKPSEHDGLKKDGTEDKRKSSEHGFGGS